MNAAAKRLTLVPQIEVFAVDKPYSKIIGDHVSVSNINCRPVEHDGTKSLGQWSAAAGELTVQIRDDDTGPRSDGSPEHPATVVTNGKHNFMLTPRALQAAVRGRTRWGMSGPAKAGRIVGLHWPLEDITRITAYRLKTWFKLLDAGFEVEGPHGARFVYDATKADSAPFGSSDSAAKAAKVSGSSVLGIAARLADAIREATGRDVRRKETRDSDLLVEYSVGTG